MVKIDAHARLHAVPAAVAARPDADIANHPVAPPEVAAEVDVLAVVIPQRLPVALAHVQPDLVEHCVIEEIAVGADDAQQPGHVDLTPDDHIGDQGGESSGEEAAFHGLLNVNCPDVIAPVHEFEPA